MHNLKEVKETYGVGDLSFFSRPGHVIECEISTTNDKKPFLVTDPIMLEVTLFNLKTFGGLGGSFIIHFKNTGVDCYSLDELKEQVLLYKLSGL